MLFWALDRFTREGLQKTIYYLQLLENYGVHFHSFQEEYLNSDNELVRELLLSVLASLAKQERRRISERTKAGLETALSKRKAAVVAKAHAKPIQVRPEDEIKDPYVLEFLGLKDECSESQLEEALIRHLEHFLLELGVGFTFVVRQKRITLSGSHYRLDLLLFHRELRCLIAIDLKIGEFTHADAGQMNLYINYLKDKEKLAQENDPVGIILCTGKKRPLLNTPWVV